MAGKFCFQRVQIATGRIHVSGPASHVQRGQEPSQSCGMHWLNARLGAGFSEELQPLVAIAQNHAYSVAVHYTERKRKQARLICMDKPSSGR
jgi:hypothetical protein